MQSLPSLNDAKISDREFARHLRPSRSSGPDNQLRLRTLWFLPRVNLHIFAVPLTARAVVAAGDWLHITLWIYLRVELCVLGDTPTEYMFSQSAFAKKRRCITKKEPRRMKNCTGDERLHRLQIGAYCIKSHLWCLLCTKKNMVAYCLNAIKTPKTYV